MYLQTKTHAQIQQNVQFLSSAHVTFKLKLMYILKKRGFVSWTKDIDFHVPHTYLFHPFQPI